MKFIFCLPTIAAVLLIFSIFEGAVLVNGLDGGESDLDPNDPGLLKKLHSLDGSFAQRLNNSANSKSTYHIGNVLSATEQAIGGMITRVRFQLLERPCGSENNKMICGEVLHLCDVRFFTEIGAHGEENGQDKVTDFKCDPVQKK